MDATVALLLLGVTAVVPILIAIIFAKAILTARAERVVGFFHPFTNDGGGGERVLWCAVQVTQQLTDLRVLIYTGDPATPESLSARAREKFGIELLSDPLVVPLQRRKWVEAATYPRFTLIGQSLGSMVLAWEALTKVTPLLFIDTSGYAFTYPLARMFGCKVACYTHYPTISSDMIQRVQSRTPLYNNDDRVTQSLVLSHVKLLYYKVVAYIYGWCGSFASLVMVNGSWTRDHIMKLWNVPKRVVRIYPPCDTGSLQALPLERSRKEPFIISVAQFRPEKAHDLQLEAFKLARDKLARGDAVKGGVDDQAMPRLKLVGSCRNSEDEERVEKLRQLCLKIGIEDDVDFCLNVPYRDLLDLLSKATAGLHTMIDEHFGISVVEYMAAGAIPIAHRSGGPKLDIVVMKGDQSTGYLAETADEFADAIIRVFSLSDADRLAMASAARRHASNFSREVFDRDFKAAMGRLLKTGIIL